MRPIEFPEEEDDPRFNLHFDLLMQRLLKAGLITHYENSPGPDGRLMMDWNPDYKSPMGGKAAFLGLATLLADICQERPLNMDEQVIIQLLRQSYSDNSESDSTPS